MKRLGASVSILGLLVIMCIWSLLSLRTECRWYAGLARQCESAVRIGDTETALKKFDALEDGWEEFHNFSGLFVDGQRIDTVREHLLGLRPLIEMQHPEVISELERTRQLIEGIYEEEVPVFWHLF